MRHPDGLAHSGPGASYGSSRKQAGKLHEASGRNIDGRRRRRLTPAGPLLVRSRDVRGAKATS